MEIEKINIPVQQALPMIAEFIKFTYITNALDKSTAWIYNKLNSETTTTHSKGFIQADLNKINEVIHLIGEKLIHTRVSFTENKNKNSFSYGDTVVEQLKSLSQIVNMPYIYIRKLNKTKSWYNNRVMKNAKVSFKEEELTFINMAIVEIGNKLLSIELTL